MKVRKILMSALSLACLPIAAAQAVDENSNTWAYLKSLGNERVIFMTSCAYDDGVKWVMFFPAGEKKGWLVQLVDGRESNYGNAFIDKASEFGATIGGGQMTMRVTSYIGDYLFKSPFMIVKPKDFHLVFDGKAVSTCPEVPDSVRYSSSP